MSVIWIKSSNLLISIGVFLNLCCQDSDQKAKMVITEKLHNSLEFVAPGVADRGWPWLTVAVAMPYRSLNDVLQYLLLDQNQRCQNLGITSKD